MKVGSADSAVASAVAALGDSKMGSLKQAAQVSVLKKANQAEAQAALTLISGIGTKLDVRG